MSRFSKLTVRPPTVLTSRDEKHRRRPARWRISLDIAASTASSMISMATISYSGTSSVLTSLAAHPAWVNPDDLWQGSRMLFSFLMAVVMVLSANSITQHITLLHTTLSFFNVPLRPKPSCSITPHFFNPAYLFLYHFSCPMFVVLARRSGSNVILTILDPLFSERIQLARNDNICETDSPAMNLDLKQTRQDSQPHLLTLIVCPDFSGPRRPQTIPESGNESDLPRPLESYVHLHKSHLPNPLPTSLHHLP